MFVEAVPISNLQSSSKIGDDDDESDNVMAVAIHYPTIKRLRLCESYRSSAALLKFVERCHGIEQLSFQSTSLRLWSNEMKEIVSLPLLKDLRLDCDCWLRFISISIFSYS
jgi:hypothetical protein